MDKRNTDDCACGLWLSIFEVDIKKIKEIQRKLEKRPEEQKGMQPELTYDCYMRQALKARNTNAICLTCSKYNGCRTYLEAVRTNPVVKPN